MQIEQLHQQTHNNDRFCQPCVSDVQVITGTQNYLDAVIYCCNEHDAFPQTCCEIVCGFRHLTG